MYVYLIDFTFELLLNFIKTNQTLLKMKLKLLSSFLLFSIFIFKAFSHTGKDTLTVQSVSRPEKTAFYQLDELYSKFPLPGQDFRLSSRSEERRVGKIFGL